ncbi:MAG: DUF5343 domain-containing protein [Bacillota bacterium]|uniref:DUF5343 domain-containing protein n=1 Tax=Desulfitobacterium hafniense TaxID=49338 RepID=UPI00035FEB86|nr:DUF5343 domain-containing protein [Desulfitobacterium hafniense]
MALPTSYMTGSFTKIPKYFEALLNAQAPAKFTTKFFEDLGFTSSNDRQFIGVLKSIGFLDEAGTPTNRYYKFLDQSNSKIMVADGIKEAYADLFQLNTSAYSMTKPEVEGKFKTLTNGSKAAGTIANMASTFVNLCSYGDWVLPGALSTVIGEPEKRGENEQTIAKPNVQTQSGGLFDLNYNIHIHLPATRDEGVYDALFASLAKHIPLK